MSTDPMPDPGMVDWESARRPSDRAIAQALYELSDKAFQTKDDEWVFPVLRIITDRATELDATAAPVVVGEDLWSLFLKHRDDISTNVLMVGTDEELVAEILAASNRPDLLR